MMSEAYDVRAGNPVYSIFQGADDTPSFLMGVPPGAYLNVEGVRAACAKAGAVPSSGLELGLARLAKNLPQEVRIVLDQQYFRLRTPTLYGLKHAKGKKLTGVALVGSNLPEDSDIFVELTGRYLDQPDSPAKTQHRLVLKAKDKLAKRIAEYARDNKQEFYSPEKNETLLALRDKEGKCLDTATSQLLFVENGVVRALYDGTPEVHEAYARDNWEKTDLRLWQPTTKDLTDLGLQAGEFECRLSGVGGRDNNDDNVNANDNFNNNAGVLPNSQSKVCQFGTFFL